MEWISNVIGLLGLATLFGGIAVVFWGSTRKGIRELLQSENAAYKESNARLHDENTDLKQQLATCKAELKIWRENVTQAPSIDKLINTSIKQHNEVITKLTDVAAGLGKLTETLVKRMDREDNK